MFDFLVSLITVLGLLVIVLFIYAIYFDPQMLNHVYCTLSTDSDLGYTACRIANY